MIMASMRIRPTEDEEIARLVSEGWHVMNGGLDEDNQPTLLCCRPFQHRDELAEYGRSHGDDRLTGVSLSDVRLSSALGQGHVLRISDPSAFPPLAPFFVPSGTMKPSGDPSDTVATRECPDTRSSDTPVTLAMLDALNGTDKEVIACAYLTNMIVGQDWRAMADKQLLKRLEELLEESQDPDAHSKVTALTEEMLRSKSGLSSMQHAAFLQKGVNLAGEIVKDTMTWRKLAWWAIANPALWCCHIDRLHLLGIHARQ